jgi:hypothetical protein
MKRYAEPKDIRLVPGRRRYRTILVPWTWLIAAIIGPPVFAAIVFLIAGHL